jgi:hypothetical protein
VRAWQPSFIEWHTASAQISGAAKRPQSTIATAGATIASRTDSTPAPFDRPPVGERGDRTEARIEVPLAQSKTVAIVHQGVPIYHPAQPQRPPNKGAATMGTVITLSDHEEIHLSTPRDGIVRGIADALDRTASATDLVGTLLPKGFVVWTDSNDEEIVVNAAQVVSVR